MKMTKAISSLNPLQLELLRIVAESKNEQELLDIKTLIARYYSEKATQEMDKFVSMNNISVDQVSDWANDHLRKSI